MGASAGGVGGGGGKGGDGDKICVWNEVGDLNGGLLLNPNSSLKLGKINRFVVAFGVLVLLG